MIEFFYPINTIYYTTLKANIEFGFRNEETEDEIRNYLKNLDTDME